MYFVDGYGDGCATVMRIHHCIGDGIALARVLLSLTDESGQGLRSGRQGRSRGTPAGAHRTDRNADPASGGRPARRGRNRPRGHRGAHPPLEAARHRNAGPRRRRRARQADVHAPGHPHGLQRPRCDLQASGLDRPHSARRRQGNRTARARHCQRRPAGRGQRCDRPLSRTPRRHSRQSPYHRPVQHQAAGRAASAHPRQQVRADLP